MKVLFDQNVPHNLRRYLSAHEVFVASELGWSELENGTLLGTAEESGFQVFITGDQSLAYQQNLAHRRIAIVELTKNNWPSVRPHIPTIVAAVDSCVPGDFITIDCAYVFKARKR